MTNSSKMLEKASPSGNEVHLNRQFQGKESILSSQISLHVQESKPKIPDGGWGWWVVFAACMLNVISEGITLSFGFLYIEFLEEFKASASVTSWIGSLFMAIPLLAGPLASALVDKYG
uniref:Monocarboxylate transporter n=2 Tax=Anoplophora glabripennis TaxID=217634 RepID=V5G9Z7_ANOGL